MGWAGLRPTRLWIAVVLAGGALGCDSGGTAPAVASPPPRRASCFAAETAAVVEGRVVWRGEVPDVAKIEGWTNPVTENGPRQRIAQPNPNAPRIARATRGVGNAVVFLRGIDPQRARPWDRSPVRVVQAGYAFHLLEGGTEVAPAFVRAGSSVEFVSLDPVFHALHLDGAEFFTLMFPDPDQPLMRRLERKGLIELSSAAGYCWMRAYLFVSDHPYFARTDPDGRYQLDGIPPGAYELVCWLPSWRISRRDREPETALIHRVFFRPSVERARSIRLAPTETQRQDFTLSVRDFDP